MKNIFAISTALFFCSVGLSFIYKDKGNIQPVEKAYTVTQYVCLPCGSSCDKVNYDKPGICSHCNMNLVNKASVKFKKIDPEALCSFIAKKSKNNVLLLDVRTPEEFNGTAPDKFGRLAGAVNIPVQDLEKRIKELAKFKGKEIIVYCSHSHRSPMASYMLMQNGFTKVTNMEYGMSEWNNKVKPTACNNTLYIKQ